MQRMSGECNDNHHTLKTIPVSKVQEIWKSRGRRHIKQEGSKKGGQQQRTREFAVKIVSPKLPINVSGYAFMCLGMYVCVWVCMSVKHLYTMLTEARRTYQIPWNWSYMQLLDTKCIFHLLKFLEVIPVITRYIENITTAPLGQCLFCFRYAMYSLTGLHPSREHVHFY